MEKKNFWELLVETYEKDMEKIDELYPVDSEENSEQLNEKEPECKSILIIDTPVSCENCPLCILLDKYCCTVNKRWCGDEQGYFTSSTKPSWCPLKKVEE